MECQPCHEHELVLLGWHCPGDEVSAVAYRSVACAIMYSRSSVAVSAGACLKDSRCSSMRAA
eukprot:6209372-Pleurochrysis_carterae.AAC.1